MNHDPRRRLHWRRRRRFGASRKPWTATASPVASPVASPIPRLALNRSAELPASQGWGLARLKSMAVDAVHMLSAWLPGRMQHGDADSIGAADVPQFGASSALLAATPGIGAMLNGLNWEGMREEVDYESRARIVIAGAPGVGKSTLVHTLNGMNGMSGVPVATDTDVRNGDGASAIKDLGLFCIVRASSPSPSPSPSTQVDDHSDGDAAAWQAMQSADLIVWVLDGTRDMHACEREWIARARATGKPMLVAVNMNTRTQAESGLAGRHSNESLQRSLGCPVVRIDALTGENVLSGLLPRMAAACDRLNTPLGREVPAWRPVAAGRVISRAAALSGLVGAEPVPLLDLPFQVMIQLRAMLRIAAIYGEPQGDRASRELLTTLIAGAGLRLATQQIAKLIPLVGWLCSGAFAAGGTWLIGWSAQHYFANGRRMPLPDVRAGLRTGWSNVPRPKLIWVRHAAKKPETQ